MPPTGLVGSQAWEEAPAHLREFSPYLTDQWNAAREAEAKAKRAKADEAHEAMLREERVKALVSKVHKYGLGVLTPEVIADLSMADYAALRPYLMEDWVLHISPNKERA